MKKLKKLSVSKDVIETLDKKIMKNVIGGITGTCSSGCATAASTITLCSGNPTGCGTCSSGCPC
ncbi:TIGR04149 family rSAM-modified RiPP [Pedobacter sp. MR2016-24]|uniref:TIGR04149 family rSAM-modified RiPP n=1 Tax=Pedobacter sp. MR2016-24 TaxID=2994466 RepID=UPI002245EF0A|nr:TIGR04149 family rSAM-modified RiPP [Pedobacter sp. MR2016-24]MCX2485511.1 TIGR04149 family rSAM-modified RiPP [Pedobacter sp. MR2016-24]